VSGGGLDAAAELRELVAELRALVEAELASGGRLDVDAPLPASVPERGAPVPAGVAPVAEVAPAAPVPATVETLAAIRDDLGDCRRCGLCAERTNLVFGIGPERARLMVIGEAPGYHEDLRGEPFVGDAGQMLDRMLANVLGLPRAEVYIANVVKCRPPDNRNPQPSEIAACLPFLRRQIRAVRPDLVLVLGSVAFRAVFDVEGGVTRARGQWREVEGIPAMVTFHPAYLLRKPEDKRLALLDLQAVRARLDAIAERGPASP
jgi:uracil-DNA glycosylase family 4